MFTFGCSCSSDALLSLSLIRCNPVSMFFQNLFQISAYYCGWKVTYLEQAKKYIDPGFGWISLDELHSRKLTGQWNIIHFDGIYQERWGDSLLSCWFSGDFCHVGFLTLPVFQKSI